jgi:Ca-activated chloride channel family protein
VRTYATTWSSGGSRDLRGARRWVNGLSADGGTNIAGALEEAFQLRSPSGRLPLVVFLTDGLPSVGERDPERIAAQAEGDRGSARVFAFGVGHDVNTYLLDRLSAAGRGSTQYVQPGEDVEAALGVLAAKIRHPVLADLEIADAPVDLTEIYPSTLPDLFAGEELVVFGRYRGADRARTGAVSISGRRSDRSERYQTEVTFPVRQSDNDFIPRLWASRKIGVLAREIRLSGPNAELEEEIRRTALRYGLLSEYTSYLVQEPLDVANVPSGTPRRQRAAAPSSMVGAGAVATAEQSRARREAKSALELEAADEALLGRGHVGQARHVAGRLFKDLDGVWTDLQHDAGTRIVRIAAFSDAYFAVLEALPELKPYVTEFGSVIVSGDQVAIHIGDAGADRLSGQAVQRLVHEFRAR